MFSVLANADLFTVASIAAGTAATLAVGLVKALDLLLPRRRGGNGGADDFRIVEMMHQQGMETLREQGLSLKDLSECLREMVVYQKQTNENVRHVRDCCDEIRAMCKRNCT